MVVTSAQLCLIIGIPSLTVILTAIDMHMRTNRLIAEIHRMCDKTIDVGGIDYRRQWEEERLIFEERVRKTYLPRGE